MEYLAQNFEDFSDAHRKYISAIKQLENEQEDNTSPASKDLVDAIQQQTASMLLFSIALGMKANLDHFIDPMARTVLDVDFDVFLRENTAHRLPEYEKAQMVINSFLDELLPSQKEVSNTIIEYISYLDSLGPKLLHYWGFSFGDEILYRLIPGYHPDRVLTMQYKSMLDGYLGKELEAI